MQNAYVSSTIYSFRTKASIFNDYSYLLNERFDRNPIHSLIISTPTPCCCDCCAFLTPRVPINPCYLYGLRQSSLLQWSGSRRLLFGGRDRVCYRVQECEPGPGCCEVSWGVRSGYRRDGRRGKGKCGCVVEEEGESEACDSEGLSDVDAVLSLLSEEVGEECFGTGRNRFKRVEVEGRSRRRGNVGLSKRVEEESRRILSGSKRNVSLSRVEEKSRRRLGAGKRNLSFAKRVEEESRSLRGREKGESSGKGRENIESVSKGVQVDLEESNRSECSSWEKKSNGRYSSTESNSKKWLESTRVGFSEKDYRHREQTGMLLRAENHRGRKEGSSCSSYYSLSSGDFGNEADARDKHGILEEPGSSVYDHSQYDRGRYDGEISEEFRNRIDDAEASNEISKRRINIVEGGGMWDWRKKSEKKLTDVVIEETNASNKSSEMHSRVMKTNKSDLAKASGSQKQFDDERENSYWTPGTKEQYSQRGTRVVIENESRSKFQEGKDTLEVHIKDAETTSQSQRRHSDREQNLAVATNLVQEARDENYKTTSHISQREDLKLSRVPQVQVVDTERTSNRRRQSETRTNQEENKYMGLIPVVQTEEQCRHIGHQVDQNATYIVQSRKGTNDIAGVSLVPASDTATNTNSQRTFDKRSTNQESGKVLAASVKETIQRYKQADEKLMRVKSRKGAESSSKASSIEEKDSEEHFSFQASLSTVFQARMQQEDFEGHKKSPQAPLLPPPSQLIARGARFGLLRETATQEGSPETSEGNSAVNYESCGGNSNTETPAEILYLNNPEDALDSAHRSDESSSQFVDEFFDKIQYGVSTSENQTAKRVSRAELVYGSEKYGQVTLTSSCSRNGSDETQGETTDLITPQDALGSAQRFEKSTSQFVGEFSEKVRHEASTSEEYGSETVSEAQCMPGGEKNGQRTSDQCGSEQSQPRGNESRRSSGGSGTKGPSIEMWDVTDTGNTSSLKSSEEEKPEATKTSEKSEATSASEKSEATLASEKLEAGTTSGNVVAKRTGRSIWNLVADLVKLRWNSHAETHPSAVRSGEKISSTESASSEGWLSGRETEESSEVNVKREKGMQPETTINQLQPVISFSQSEEVSNTGKSKDKVRYLETGMTSSPNREESRLTSKSISLSSGEETLSPKDYQKNFRGTSSGIQIVESSQPQITTGIKSHLIEEISNAGYTISGSGSKENMDQFGRQKLGEESDNVLKGAEMKLSKLKRNKQVLKDKFDEWEEAHTRESEQRKNDEFFMREALLEAKKAADTWEVPVGAVLVQQGRVIARGFNLVEELRDSTAHAEMICIREASSVLRTWRLADCTLYVTLEPCPMCAGAIYQARVDTVVWGAPNKLLGADGSWIRLFPDGSQGSESEQSNKPAAPVHPFHPNITIRRGVLASECADIMQQFFQLRRRKKEKRQSTPPAPPSTRAVSHHPRKILNKLHDVFHIMFCL
ncbi:tRNA(adenine(34)) deaminase, chloroplastic [Argentina anserina]|uniref:tRNA(adenine(34)) deaminase, chloroplastic n=1 Tax=Argentina anserina TaxID=57926 RepID=UPI00217631A0|nr:tRNA(adenine(34)) deaminase, chloroplastic [Potentilla anserina]